MKVNEKDYPRKNKLHTSIRIDDLSPSHVVISIFTALAYEDETRDLSTLTRGRAGQITIGRDEFVTFVSNFPSIVKLSKLSKLSKVGALPIDIAEVFYKINGYAPTVE